jgi:hypothetical protein
MGQPEGPRGGPLTPGATAPAEEPLTVRLTRREIKALVEDAARRGLLPTSTISDAEALQSAFKKLLATIRPSKPELDP